LTPRQLWLLLAIVALLAALAVLILAYA